MPTTPPKTPPRKQFATQAPQSPIDVKTLKSLYKNIVEAANKFIQETPGTTFDHEIKQVLADYSSPLQSVESYIDSLLGIMKTLAKTKQELPAEHQLTKAYDQAYRTLEQRGIITEEETKKGLQSIAEIEALKASLEQAQTEKAKADALLKKRSTQIDEGNKDITKVLSSLQKISDSLQKDDQKTHFETKKEIFIELMKYSETSNIKTCLNHRINYLDDNKSSIQSARAIDYLEAVLREVSTAAKYSKDTDIKLDIAIGLIEYDSLRALIVHTTPKTKDLNTKVVAYFGHNKKALLAAKIALIEHKSKADDTDGAHIDITHQKATTALFGMLGGKEVVTDKLSLSEFALWGLGHITNEMMNDKIDAGMQYADFCIDALDSLEHSLARPDVDKVGAIDIGNLEY